MRGGDKALCTAAALLAAGCTSDDGKLNVRPIADPLAAATKGGGTMLDHARGLLALGSTGLALEAFRKALRERPDSVEALAGVAACYERMGRYDLARVNYEAALAIAPRNPVLLSSFAASLELQGKRAEARALRAEAARVDADDAATLAQAAPAQPVTVTQWKIETRAAPPPSNSLTVPLPAPRVARTAPPVVAAAKPTPVAEQKIAASEPVQSAPLQAMAVASPPAAAPARAAARPVSPARPIALPKGVQPRLQRLSTGEVALLTGSGPAWRTQVVAESRQSVTVRFVPLRAASVRPNIRLLNAARRQGLAARTRALLVDRGWRRIEIGDAAQVRARSVVLYSPNRQWLARRLASQFGFSMAPHGRSDEVVVLLGRDAPMVLRTRG